MFSHGNHPNKLGILSDHIVLHAATTPFVFFLCLSYKINIKHLSGRICATICGDLLLSNFIFIKLPDIKNEGGDLHWPHIHVNTKITY
jgi:hypothetical protein